MKLSVYLLIGTFAFCTFALCEAPAAEFRWQGDASDNWQAGTNWVGSSEPPANSEIWFNTAFGGGGDDPTIKPGNSNKRHDRLRVTNPDQAVTLTISNGRILRIDKATRSIDMRTAGKPLTITGGGTFRQTDDSPTPLYDLDGSGSGNLTISTDVFQVEGGATLTVDVSAGRQAKFVTGITGSTSGSATAASLVKRGAGLLILGGTNLHTGVTTVTGGTLRVTGSMDRSALTATAGTVEGGGTFGDVTISGTAIHAPGLSPGIDTVDGDYTLAGTLEIELGGTTPGVGAGFHDQVFVDETSGDLDGLVTLTGGTLDVSLFGGFTPSLDDSFTIIDNDGIDAVVGTFLGLPEGSIVNVTGTSLPIGITYTGGTGNDVVLRVAVPEPSSFALVLLGVLLLGCFVRRRG